MKVDGTTIDEMETAVEGEDSVVTLSDVKEEGNEQTYGDEEGEDVDAVKTFDTEILAV